MSDEEIDMIDQLVAEAAETPLTREQILAILNADAPALDKVVKVRWVLPGWLLTIATAVVVLLMMNATSNQNAKEAAEREADRQQVVNFLTFAVQSLQYQVDLTDHQRCLGSHEARAAIRLLVIGLAEQTGMDPAELPSFMEGVDETYPQVDVATCPPEPIRPEVPEGVDPSLMNGE